MVWYVLHLQYVGLLPTESKYLWRTKVKVKVNTSFPLHAWTGSEGCRTLRLPFIDSRYTKVIRLLALRTGRLYAPPGTIPGIHLCNKLSRPHGHSVAGRIVSMRKSFYNIGNRTRDLPACGPLFQPTNQSEGGSYCVRWRFILWEIAAIHFVPSDSGECVVLATV